MPPPVSIFVPNTVGTTLWFPRGENAFHSSQTFCYIIGMDERCRNCPIDLEVSCPSSRGQTGETKVNTPSRDTVKCSPQRYR